MHMNRQRRTIGAVHEVPLPDGKHIHAVALPEADFAFLDTRSTALTKIDEIFEHPVLFRVAVHKSAWNTGRWPKVGRVRIPEALLSPQPTFIEDSLHPGRFEIYLAGKISPATRAECEGLERSAVWEPEHVEERIESHYEGRPSKWVESLRMK